MQASATRYMRTRIAAHLGAWLLSASMMHPQAGINSFSGATVVRPRGDCGPRAFLGPHLMVDGTRTSPGRSSRDLRTNDPVPRVPFLNLCAQPSAAGRATVVAANVTLRCVLPLVSCASSA
jgi:hypothetical protein